MAKVMGILKVAKFAGKVLGGVATAAGIYEGAKIVGNGVTAGLEAIRSRNVPPPPSPPAGSTPIAGADELWVAGSDLANAARSLVGAAQCPDEAVVSGPRYDCSESGREVHRQRLLQRGYSPDYVEARVSAVREYTGCEGDENRQVYLLAVNQLQSEGVPRLEAVRAVLDASVRMKRGLMVQEEPVQEAAPAYETSYQEQTYVQPFAPAYQFGPAPVSFQFSAPSAPTAKSPFGALSSAPKKSSKLTPVFSKIGGADELWTGAGPTEVRPGSGSSQAWKDMVARAGKAGASSLSSPKLTNLKNELARFERLQVEAETRLNDYTRDPIVTQTRDVRYGSWIGDVPLDGAGTRKESYQVKLSTIPAGGRAIYQASVELKKRQLSGEVDRAKANVEQQKRLVQAEEAFLRSQDQAAKAKKAGDAALAASKAQEATVAKQLADTAAELDKKKAELEAKQKQAASDAEKAKLEAKIAQLEAQSKNVAQLAAAPAQAIQVAQQPSESGQIIGQLLAALLQKGAPPEQQAQAAAEKLSEGEAPAPEADSEPMDASDMDEFVSGYGYVYGHDEAHGGSCCDACASGLACEGDSCPVSAVAGDEGGKAPWTLHWASTEAPAWALGIFAGGPGIPSTVSADTCSTGSCRMPK